MLSSTQCRTLAVGAFGLFGSALAFLMGAHIGNSLDHHVRTLTVARVPIPALAVARVDHPASPLVAQK